MKGWNRVFGIRVLSVRVTTVWVVKILQIQFRESRLGVAFIPQTPSPNGDIYFTCFWIGSGLNSAPPSAKRNADVWTGNGHSFVHPGGAWLNSFPNFRVVRQLPANVVLGLETTLLDSSAVLHRFLGAFVRLRQQTVSYMSVYPHGKTRPPHCTNFH